jgi:drug/metabolite transporter (DMT)-like permease
MTEMTVTENVSCRFLTGAILLLPALLRRWKPYRGNDLALMLLASVGGIPIQFLIQFRGLQLTSVSHASLFAAVAMILVSKRLIPQHGSLHATAVTIVIGTILLLTSAGASHRLRFHFPAHIWGAAIAQGVFATAGAYLFWNWGLSHMAASRAGVFLDLEPVMGTVLRILILPERLGMSAIVGGFLIIGAAVYFSMPPEHGSSKG